MSSSIRLSFFKILLAHRELGTFFTVFMRKKVTFGTNIRLRQIDKFNRYLATSGREAPCPYRQISVASLILAKFEKLF